MTRLRTIAVACALLPAIASAQHAPSRANRAVYLDSAGVIRWRDTKGEVALFGANYALPSASDYRAAGYLGLDRRKLVDDDMAHFARMGWDALRLATWGDWENADSAGNLIANEHLDLLDYVIARARERGIYMLLTPIQTYDAGWPDSLSKSPTYPGFSRRFQRAVLGTDRAAIAAQANYLRQVMNHVNPYTGVAYKDEPAILFVEMINEPVHHPEDLAGAVRYIDTLVAAVRSTGARQILFHNLSQDFAIAKAIRASAVQGITFGWYPTGLNSGHELRGNYLRTVDSYDAMLDSSLRRYPRIVYEFDSPDLRTGYMYPAMARTFRAVGAQLATMFAYDMLGTASRNLGWQTHYLNLVYTPRKAMSAVIAAEAMRRLPRYQGYGAYPRDTAFGDFRVSYEENSGVLAAADAFLNAGATRAAPPVPERLTRVAGYGSSPVVGYEGEGSYFLDRVRAGVWRLEVYPDAVPVADPFEPPRPDKVVTRAISRAWPMTIRLPDLGASFGVERIAGESSGARSSRATGGRFDVTPGVYLLAARGAVDRATLPAYVGALRMDEYHAPRAEPVPVHVETTAAPQFVAGRPAEIGARVVDAASPDSVTLSTRPLGRSWFQRHPMRRVGAYDYRAVVPADSLGDGPFEYAVTVARGDSVVTFPGGVRARPGDWDFSGPALWTATVVRPTTPLRLFGAAADVPRLAFTRIGDAGRTGIFRTVVSPVTGEPAFHLELPDVGGGRRPDDYTASLVVVERVAARGSEASRARAVRVRLRGVGAHPVLRLTLVERDGTSWSAAVAADSAWADRVVPLSAFTPARGVKLPEGYPGEWNYWVGPAQGRARSGDAVRAGEIERVQLSLRAEDLAPGAPRTHGVEVEGIWLLFE